MFGHSTHTRDALLPCPWLKQRPPNRVILRISDPDERAVERPPLVLNRRTMGWIGNYVSSIVESKTPLWWWACMAVTTPLALLLFGCIIYLISTGVGVWGNNIPVGWAWDITNFVFWIGIGHAGTLISAILFLTRQKWRTSINRAAEAMTLFAVICAAIYPGFHIGRVWMAWFMAPVPNSNGIWQNFRSPLLWDVFAVGTYFTVSVLFWYTGLIPDLATLRDRATTKIRKFAYGILALGWRGEQPSLAALRDGLSHSCRSFHAAGSLGALGRVLRLRHLSHSRLAHDDLPAVFRSGRDFWRLCDGAHHHDSGLRDLQAAA